MKVKCVRLLDHEGKEVSSSPWLQLGRTYHVLSIFIDAEGKRRFGVDSQVPGEWPSNAEHQAECFEITSTVVPSNWCIWIDQSSAVGISPGAWQVAGFADALADHDPTAYPIFERERLVILTEDP